MRDLRTTWLSSIAGKGMRKTQYHCFVQMPYHLIFLHRLCELHATQATIEQRHSPFHYIPPNLKPSLLSHLPAQSQTTAVRDDLLEIGLVTGSRMSSRHVFCSSKHSDPFGKNENQLTVYIAGLIGHLPCSRSIFENMSIESFAILSHNSLDVIFSDCSRYGGDLAVILDNL